MYKPFKNRAGFTLAEVLITLGIIGVVAALTIPALMQKTQNQELVTALKKNYSALSQAYVQILQDGSDKPDFEGDGDIIVKFADKMKFSKICTPAEFEDCWGAEAPKTLNNIDEPVFYSDLAGSGESNFGILADGTSIGAFNVDSDCAYAQGDDQMQRTCAQMYIDVNGRKKPNIVGRDVFAFSLNLTGVAPDGSHNGVASDGNGGLAICDKSVGTYEASVGCTAQVLTESKMSY